MQETKESLANAEEQQAFQQHHGGSSMSTAGLLCLLQYERRRWQRRWQNVLVAAPHRPNIHIGRTIIIIIAPYIRAPARLVQRSLTFCTAAARALLVSSDELNCEH
ncbi:unnamed protein product [Ceratitis capitata]|uniref:(Mediterranean fruit fly) hypothetical protein n=1 Tax=Ceratitis capitata TaxID=7213 RepID=A0A811UJM9_CERCA|nr:unnamed protein product [Ceratitis capitata]